MVRWWWFGVAVDKPEILRELHEMHADGIGGAELAFVYPDVLDDPAIGLRNLRFLSPEMLDAIGYAQAEGRKLGLRIDVTLCSGWPYGGPNTPLSQAAGRLRIVELAVPSGASSVRVPTLEEGEALITATIVPGAPGHWKAPPAALALPLALSNAAATFPAATESRVALFFIASHTRQQVKRAALGAEGYVLDPFSRQAVATHLEKVGEPLITAFGSTPPYAIFSDSLEAYGADWTPDLPAEFRKRQGYDLIPHLPELVAGGTPAAEKVRHDYGRTLTALVNENYLLQINDWARAHRTRFRSQTYGEPAVSFASQRLVDLPEGEGPQWRDFSTLRWATSANHVFGNKVTSGETYTWLHSPVFRATPLDMKMEADIDFIMGENQLIFHGWPYSPPTGTVSEPESPYPGWSLYASAVFNDHNPWHPVMPAVTKYIARLSWLLRQGEPANQVALLLPTDDAWAGFAPGKVSVTEALRQFVTPEMMSAILTSGSKGGGYNVDFIDADSLNSVGLGAHQVLVLPPTDRIPLATLRDISAWVERGGKAIAIRRPPSLDAEGEALPEIAALSQKLFNLPNGTLVPSEADLPQALVQAAPPDFALVPRVSSSEGLLRSVAFIRRKLTGADIYFVANTSNLSGQVSATFSTGHAFGVELDPDTGLVIGRMHNDHRSSRSSEIDLVLRPYESRVFLFTDEDAVDSRPSDGEVSQLADLSTNWEVTFVATGKKRMLPTLTDWAADPATLHYSGEVFYSRNVTLSKLPAGSVSLVIGDGTYTAACEDGSIAAPNTPQAVGPDGLPDPKITRTGPGIHADLAPPLREAALVVINGQPAGSLWHPPYRLDVTKFLRTGHNSVEVHVYNTLLNAWSGAPPHNYKPLAAKYGDRFQMQDLDRVRPLPSGILGEVHLMTTSPNN